MNNRTLALISVLTGSLACSVAIAADHDHGSANSGGTTTPAEARESSEQARAAWLAAAKLNYPLTTCVVSDDKLEGGDMGAPIDYVYSQEGKPDRLVRLCCKDCIKDFKKDPAKYVAMIEVAAAKKAAERATAAH